MNPWIEDATWMAPGLILTLWVSLLAVSQRLLATHPLARWLPAVAGVGVGLAGLACVSTLVRAPELMHGMTLLGGRLWVDLPSVSLDLLICGGLLATLTCLPRERRPSAEPLVLMVGVGAMLACHSGDFLTLLLGLEIGSLAMAGLLAPRSIAGLRWLIPQALTMALTWLGVVFLYGAAGSLQWRELSLNAVAVFTKWGAGTTQKAVEILLTPELPLGIQGVEQLRDAAVTGMAPAALFIPGLILVVAGLCLRLTLTTGLAQAPWAWLLVRDGVLRLGVLGAMLHLLVSALNSPRLTYPPYGWSLGLSIAAGLVLVSSAVGVLRAHNPRVRVLCTGLHHAGWWLLSLVAAGEIYAYAGLRFAGVRHQGHYDWALETGEQVVAALFAMVASTTIATAGLLASWSPERRSLMTRIGQTLILLAFIGAPLSAVFGARGWGALALLNDSNTFVRGLVLVALAASVCVWGAWLPTLRAWWQRPVGDTSSATGQPGRSAALVLWSTVVLSWGVGLVGPQVVHGIRTLSVGASISVASRTRSRRVSAWEAATAAASSQEAAKPPATSEAPSQ